MLTELTVENFAVIEWLRLEPRPGFNVLTGETGAGKSILIDAVAGLLGARLGADVVRAGAPAARVEGIFEVGRDDAALRGALDEIGAGSDDDNVIVSREVTAAGRGVARVNGRAVTASALAQLAPHLVDIHGQSENLSLLRAGTQLRLLDAFAGLDAHRAAVAELVGELRRLRRAREALQRDERELARTMELLRFQSEEIAATAIQPAEDDELAAERRVLANAERLIELADGAYATLVEGSDDRPPAVDLLGRTELALTELAKLDEAQAGFAARAGSLTSEASELARDVRAYRDGVDVDPDRLAQVDERLELLKGLKRKYGPTLSDVCAFGQRAAAELADLASGQSRLEDLAAREVELLAALAGRAIDLSDRRRAAADRLAAAVEDELAYLDMANARFAVAFEQATDPNGLPVGDRRVAFDPSGIDRVELLIAPNPGEPLRPLARIASGGETARLMLALKATLAAVDPVPVLIFDEVDAGIGGRSGHVVGEKLAQLSRSHQVICVTHLPQIASFADAHFRIVKTVDGDRTRTTVARLDDAGRLEELAAMLGGTRLGLDHARALIEEAQQVRRRAMGVVAGG